LRTVNLKIEDIAFGGKGVARESGKAIFVPLTIDGERVSAQIVREKKQFAEAELGDVQEISPHRVDLSVRTSVDAAAALISTLPTNTSLRSNGGRSGMFCSESEK
jgi:tRNA/tmRNA/rRNA uracil-C5-methylase (TrmA/RlmC/RlmD family)